MTAANRVPTEIWAMVASYASRPDLRSLALVSRVLCKVSREILAQYLYIEHEPDIGNRDLEKISQLGALDLLRFVRAMSVRWIATPGESFMYPIAWTPRLKALKIWVPHDKVVDEDDEEDEEDEEELGVPLWSTPAIQTHAVHILNSVRLESLDFDGGKSSFLEDDFPLSTLKSLIWDQEKTISDTFLSICRASATNLTHLCLHVYLPPTDPQYLELFSLRLSSLETFEIGEGYYFPPVSRDPWQPDEVMTAFTGFLLAHPTIQRLNLFCEGETVLDIHAGWTILPIDTTTAPLTFLLPNLDSISAHPAIIQFSAKAGAQFLRTISTYELVVRDEVNMNDFVDEMFRSLREYKSVHGPLNRLRTLILQICRFAQPTYFTDFVDWFDTVTDVFPNLETYIGDVESMDVLLMIFVKFKHLRYISCSSYEFELEDVRTLAERIPTLEKIRCFASGLTYTITRTTNGHLQVIEQYEDIPDDDVRYLQYVDAPTSPSSGSFEEDTDTEYWGQIWEEEHRSARQTRSNWLNLRWADHKWWAQQREEGHRRSATKTRWRLNHYSDREEEDEEREDYDAEDEGEEEEEEEQEEQEGAQ